MRLPSQIKCCNITEILTQKYSSELWGCENSLHLHISKNMKNQSNQFISGGEFGCYLLHPCIILSTAFIKPWWFMTGFSSWDMEWVWPWLALTIWRHLTLGVTTYRLLCVFWGWLLCKVKCWLQLSFWQYRSRQAGIQPCTIYYIWLLGAKNYQWVFFPVQYQEELKWSQ